jgi:LemA protein
MVIFYNTLIALSIIIILVLIFLWSKYNSFVLKRNQVKVDYSDVDVQLKRRASLIEQLAHMVREYAKHEKTTFEDVARARSALDRSKTIHEAATAENMFTQTLRSLFALVEKYPELKASQNYQTLAESLKESENLIAQYREEYNESVRQYNNAVQTFPSLLAAQLFRFGEEEYFQSGSIN